jgi:hypothetical protein
MRTASRARTRQTDATKLSLPLMGRPLAQPLLSQPGDASEREADALAARALQADGPRLDTGAARMRDEQPLDDGVRRWAEPRFSHDFSRVRVHAGDRAAAQADALDARAFTYGRDIVLGRGNYSPESVEGRSLLAHELAHVALGTGRAIRRKTKGEIVVDKAHADWLDPDASVKAEVDVIKVALKEIKQKKSVSFNQNAALKHIAAALTTLGKAAGIPAAVATWNTLVKNSHKSGSKSYQATQKGFFALFQSPLAALSAKHPKAQTKEWLKNTPSQVLDEIIGQADSEITAEQLWAYANKEGLFLYVRNEIGLGKNADPTAAQLQGVSTTKDISGFEYIGSDDFFTDLTARKEPLSGYLPKGYDVTKLTLDPHKNEKKRMVQSAIFPNLKMGLQALVATMKRARKIFRDEVKQYGYATPSLDELVYWTYVYYNSGVFNHQLRKHKGKRVLSDWITRKEFPNAFKLLESFRMVRAMKIF